MIKISKFHLNFVLSLILVGCDSSPIRDWIKQSTSFQGSAIKSVKTGHDVQVASLKSAETHKFLTDFSIPYKPLDEKDACKENMESGIYKKERSIYEKRVKLIKNLAEYADKLDKLLKIPDKTTVGEMINVSESIISTAGAASLDLSPWSNAAKAGVVLLKKSYKLYQEQQAMNNTYEFIKKENAMISSLTLQLSKVLLLLDKEAVAAQMAWASCEADSLNFAKHLLLKDTSKTIALLELEDRHRKFLDQRQELDERIAELSSFTLEKDDQGVIRPLADLKKAHNELAAGPQVSAESVFSSLPSLKAIAADLEGLYNSFPKSVE